MRRRHGRSIGAAILVVLMLLIGTVIGRAMHLGPLSLPVGFAPLSVNLYVASVALGLQTNVLGLIGAVVGIVLARYV